MGKFDGKRSNEIQYEDNYRVMTAQKPILKKSSTSLQRIETVVKCATIDTGKSRMVSRSVFDTE